MSLIEERIKESVVVKERILQDESLIDQINSVSERISECMLSGGKVLLCGNGGSASDALHITGELVGRFQRERKAIAAVCLNADMVTMTAIANDYGYDRVFERVIDGLMKPQDVLIGISTSGNSENVFLAIKRANEIGGKTIAFLGKNGGKIRGIADISIVVPEDNTARIQESHIMIGHIICELAENAYVDQEA